MKKKGLLVWFEMDRRLELLQPFIDMSDEIEFTHLFFRTREERTVQLSPFKIIYWFDYNTPYELIRKHKPDFIIGATEVLQTISLIVAAKEKNIPYYGLQHGFSTENFVSIVKKVTRESPFSPAQLKKHFKTSLFYFSSLRLKTLGRIFQYTRLFVLFYKKFPEEAIIDGQYKWVKPTCYLCFSEISSGHYKYLYKLEDSEIKYIGIPSFDSLFKAFDFAKRDVDGEKYYLLIDTSFIDYHKPISDEQIWRCYDTLNEYCRQQGTKLYIKLHPRNYDNPGLHDANGIHFVRNMEMKDLAELIVNAQGCFGFFSTLTMPIAFMIPTIQIRYDEVYDKLLVENRVTPELDFYNFRLQDIRFNPVTSIDEQLKRKFLFATDGNTVQRMKNILLG
jgi:hypothetical protein